jgi:hypothetical protein
VKVSRDDETEFVTVDLTRSEIYILVMALHDKGEPASAGDLLRHNQLIAHLDTAYTLQQLQ